MSIFYQTKLPAHGSVARVNPQPSLDKKTLSLSIIIVAGLTIALLSLLIANFTPHLTPDKTALLVLCAFVGSGAAMLCASVESGAALYAGSYQQKRTMQNTVEYRL